MAKKRPVPTKNTTKKTRLSSVRTTIKAAERAVEVHAKAQEKLKLASEKGPGKQLAGFVNFIREKGVVGLAVGLAIGTAATGVVTQIVNSVITPAIGLLIGKDGLSAWNFTVTVGDRSEIFAIGTLIDALIKFTAIAAVIYFVIMGLKIDKLDKKKE